VLRGEFRAGTSSGTKDIARQHMAPILSGKNNVEVTIALLKDLAAFPQSDGQWAFRYANYSIR